MIDEGIVSLLAANADVQAILNTGAAAVASLGNGTSATQAAQNAIFQTSAPPDTRYYPCLAFKFVGGTSMPTFSTSGMQRARLEVHCWATTPDVAKQLADAVRQALNGYQGVLSDGTPLADAAMLHAGLDFLSDDSLYFSRMLEFYLLYTFTD